MRTMARDRPAMLASPTSTARTWAWVGAAVAVVGLVGLVDPWFALPLAALVLVVALLAAFIPVEERRHALHAAGSVPTDPDLDRAELDGEDGDLAAAPVDDLRDAAPATGAPAPAPTAADEPDDAPVVDEPARVVRRFRLPAEVDAERAWLVGELNDWSLTAHPMVRDDEGFHLDVELEPGRTYRYRYLLDGDRWENDWAADRYEPNLFGGDDSVVVT